MSGFHGGRGRGRRGGGRGGRGGRNNHHSNRGPPGDGGSGAPPPPLLNPCRNWISSTCNRGDSCTFSHSIKVHADIQNSNKKEQDRNSNRYNNNNNNYHPTSDVAVWNDPATNTLKIFTASHDGYWRLYTTAGGNIVREFEHNMGGQIDTLTVASNFLFCGFEGPHVRIPGANVGMIHAWNLSCPNDPPVELVMNAELTPYAHASRISAFVTNQDMCMSGSKDGVIRIWKFDSSLNGGKGAFGLSKECCGHAGEITGLAMANGMLWSSSTDGTIRLWDASWECKHLITSGENAGQPPPPQSGGATGSENKGSGHTMAVTDLVPFECAQGNFVLSSSLDGDVKVWNSTNGECLSTTNHGTGIVCMALSADMKGNPILFCGCESGKIMIRMIMQTATTEPMRLIMNLDANYTKVGHYGPIKKIISGPNNTFYSVGNDGKLIVWLMTSDFGI